MKQVFRWLAISAGVLALAAFAAGPVSAADISKVDAATKQVESGAKKIGDGKVIEGTEQAAKGIGTTAVEGTKVTGEKFKEAAKATEPQAKTAGQQAKDGAVSFGTSIKTFFTSLFSK